jgi:hypothetical protein
VPAPNSDQAAANTAERLLIAYRDCAAGTNSGTGAKPESDDEATYSYSPFRPLMRTHPQEQCPFLCSRYRFGRWSGWRRQWTKCQEQRDGESACNNSRSSHMPTMIELRFGALPLSLLISLFSGADL